jgi:hypothetical protein
MAKGRRFVPKKEGGKNWICESEKKKRIIIIN